MVGYNPHVRRVRITPTACIVALLLIFSAVFGWFVGLFLYTPIGLCETYICTTQKWTWVNVREQPNPNSNIIGKIRFGYEVESDGEENGYFRIAFQDGTAYVRKEYLEKQFKARAIANSRVYLRAKPGGKKLRHLNKGNWIDIMAVTTDADGTEWYRCYGNVYAMARYLEVTSK